MYLNTIIKIVITIFFCIALILYVRIFVIQHDLYDLLLINAVDATKLSFINLYPFKMNQEINKKVAHVCAFKYNH